MKRIGIITHYHNSVNYGGNLQAYALTTYLNNNGAKAEQISFDHSLSSKQDKTIWQKLADKGIKGSIAAFFSRLRQKRYATAALREESNHNVTARRKKAFYHFNQVMIPHSEEVYFENTLSNCVDNYDVFITGSDQVWNPDHYLKGFFLDFVPTSKTKISYAASIAKGFLTEEEKAIFKKSLADYDAISLRERSAVSLVESAAFVKAVQVLDPVFLLTKEEWESIASENQIGKPYVFCYFLGNNKKARKAAQAFAQKRGLTLVLIAQAAGKYSPDDCDFGDIRLYDASPEDFLSLICHAEYIFTDSFHALAFSHIFQKEYFVFNRNKNGSMNSRIIDMTALLQTEDHFLRLPKQETASYAEGLSAIDYRRENDRFDTLRKQSEEFLLRQLS